MLYKELDEMARLLATPEQWCKGAYQTQKREGQAYCIVGAYSAATGHGGDRLYYPPGAAWLALLQQVKTLATFNDDPATTHADILALIARARASLLDRS